MSAGVSVSQLNITSQQVSKEFDISQDEYKTVFCKNLSLFSKTELYKVLSTTDSAELIHRACRAHFAYHFAYRNMLSKLTRDTKRQNHVKQAEPTSHYTKGTPSNLQLDNGGSNGSCGDGGVVSTLSNRLVDDYGGGGEVVDMEWIYNRANELVNVVSRRRKKNKMMTSLLKADKSGSGDVDKDVMCTSRCDSGEGVHGGLAEVEGGGEDDTSPCGGGGITCANVGTDGSDMNDGAVNPSIELEMEGGVIEGLTVDEGISTDVDAQVSLYDIVFYIYITFNHSNLFDSFSPYAPQTDIRRREKEEEEED